ncbi:MAG: hypothetical protein JSW21_00265, partial [Gammaproteobacteria bacterium]
DIGPLQPAASADFGAPLNKLDGFSVFSRIQANFSEAVAAESLNEGSVFLLEVALDPKLARAVVGLSEETLCKLGLVPEVACPPEIFNTGNPFLVQGEDYELSVAPDIDAGGTIIQLDPLRPLNPFTEQQFNEGAINGYLLIVTDRVTNTGGTAAAADATYEQIKQGFLAGLIQLPPEGAPLPPLPLEELLALHIASHLTVVDALHANGAPVSVEDVVVTASFSPQDTTTVMQTVAGLDILDNRPSQIAQAIVPVDVPLPGDGVLPAGTPVTTGLLKTLLGLPPEAISDNGDVYFGGLNIPYFLEPPSEETGGLNVLTSHWVAEAGQNVLGDPDSTVISRWNPVPVKRADLTIPMVISIPNDNSAWVQAAKAQSIPVPLPTGWPVVIYQPGVTRFRGDQPLVAEPWLDLGYAVISIDLPGHGVTASDPVETAYGNLFRVPGTVERTFDLDLRNNVDLADFTPDGEIDPRFVNFSTPAPQSFLQLRDIIREAAAGVLALRRSIGVMDVDGNPETTDFDTSQTHYVGHSGGGILGGINLAICGSCASISMPSGGAGWIKLLQESDREDGFGFLLTFLEAALAEGGVLPNTTIYNNLLRDWQNVWDAGDPIGYLKLARQSATPVFGTLVNTDVAVTPAASLRLFEGLGLPQITTPGINLVSKGYTRMLDGEHSSFLSPEVSPAATIEMQTEVALFIGGNPLAGIPPNGQAIVISNPDIVETE